MDKLTDLYRIIQDEKIYLQDYKIPNHAATTICYEDKYSIFVDYSKINTLMDEFRVVVHEYGHCASGTTHRIHSPYQLISKHEYKANKCSIHKFLPYKVLQDAINKGYTEIWEIAEYLNLPEDFIMKADYIYRCEGLLNG